MIVSFVTLFSVLCPSKSEPQLDFLTRILESKLSELEVTSELETISLLEAWLRTDPAVLSLRGIDPVRDPFEDEL